MTFLSLSFISFVNIISSRRRFVYVRSDRSRMNRECNNEAQWPTQNQIHVYDNYDLGPSVVEASESERMNISELNASFAQPEDGRFGIDGLFTDFSQASRIPSSERSALRQQSHINVHASFEHSALSPAGSFVSPNRMSFSTQPLSGSPFPRTTSELSMQELGEPLNEITQNFINRRSAGPIFGRTMFTAVSNPYSNLQPCLETDENNEMAVRELHSSNPVIQNIWSNSATSNREPHQQCLFPSNSTHCFNQQPYLFQQFQHVPQQNYSHQGYAPRQMNSCRPQPNLVQAVPLAAVQSARQLSSPLPDPYEDIYRQLSYNPSRASTLPFPLNMQAAMLDLNTALLQCADEYRQLEKDRKKTEAELAIRNLGKKISSNNHLDIPRLPSYPFRLDRVIVDHRREHAKLVTLLSRMEQLRKAPLPPDVHRIFDELLHALVELEALREEERRMWSKIFSVDVPHTLFFNYSVLIRLRRCLKTVEERVIRARAANWCSLMWTIGADQDEEKFIQRIVSANFNMAPPEIKASCKPEKSTTEN